MPSTAGRYLKTLDPRKNKFRFMLTLKNGDEPTFFIDTSKDGADLLKETIKRGREEKGVIGVVYNNTDDKKNPREVVAAEFDPDP